MNIRNLTAVCALSLSCVMATGYAAETKWINPAIPDFGASADLPNAAMQPDKNADYKVVFNVTAGATANEKINPSLEKVARAANIFASAGVPLSHLHFIAVVHGPATPSILDNDHYKEKFSVDNPNVKLISELKAAGVKVVVCGQALAGQKFPHEWVNPDVEITLSAISSVIMLEMQGYAMLPM